MRKGGCGVEYTATPEVQDSSFLRWSSILAESKDRRRSPRIPFEQLRTELEFGGASYPVQVTDLSEEGMRLVLASDVDIRPDQKVKIAVGKISPNIRGRVRWVSVPEQDGTTRELGVNFEAFLLVPPEEDEIQGLLDAWQAISQSYTIVESFLHIVESLDFEIVDGKIDDLSDAVYSITLWLDQRLGALNLWSVLTEPDGSTSCQELVARHPGRPGEAEERKSNVTKAAEQHMTMWFEGRPYFFGGDVVIEYLGEDHGQADLLQRLAVMLSRRIRFWSKLLMKNIALQLFGEEIERLKS